MVFVLYSLLLVAGNALTCMDSWGDLIARLKATSRLAWLVYVSDHGETPDIRGWRVTTEPSTWEIPLLQSLTLRPPNQSIR